MKVLYFDNIVEFENAVIETQKEPVSIVMYNLTIDDIKGGFQKKSRLAKAISDKSNNKFNLAITADGLIEADGEIPEGCFWEVNNLVSVDLNHWDSIGPWAFALCSNLEEIMANDVRVIKERAFFRCESLKDVHLDAIKKIDYGAFNHCISLVDFPKNPWGKGLSEHCKEIGKYAFYECYNLSEKTKEEINKVINKD